MNYLDQITAQRDDAAGLERLYRDAATAGAGNAFRAALEAAYAAAPDHSLLAAWHYRLSPDESAAKPAGGRSPWPIALGLSLVCAIVFGLLMQPDSFNSGPLDALLGWLWAPLSATFILVFLMLAGQLPWRRVLPVLIALAGLTAYAYVLGNDPDRLVYGKLMLIHIPLLSWIAAGVGILGLRSAHNQRFAFLLKSVELLITGILFAGVGGVLVGISAGMFGASGILENKQILNLLIRCAAGGAGLIPVLATATIYDPRLTPLEQHFEAGLSRLLATLLRLALPLTLLVLVVYLFVIPFTFMRPFQDRDVLIIYNLMLFAVMALLIGASPAKIPADGLKGEKWLRAGLMVLAGLTILVSLYAMSATAYRTIQGGLTVNRVTIIGWNTINIGILATLLYRQLRQGLPRWLAALHSALSTGTIAYVVWTAFLVLAMPWLFR